MSLLNTIRHEVAHVFGYKLLCGIQPIQLKINSNGTGVVMCDAVHNPVKFLLNPEAFDEEYLYNYAAQAIMGPLNDSENYYKIWRKLIDSNNISQRDCTDYANIMSCALIIGFNRGVVSIDTNTIERAVMSKQKVEGVSIEVTYSDPELFNRIASRVWLQAESDARDFLKQYGDKINAVAERLHAHYKGKSFKLNATQINYQLKLVGV